MIPSTVPRPKHLFLAFIAAIVSCGPAPQPEASKPPSLPDLPRAIAEDVRFPLLNRKFIAVVNAPMLGLSYLAAGNLAQYDVAGKPYKLLTIRCRSAQQAGAYIFDIKNQMKDPRFVASYGGYFSETSAGPLFVFAKGAYIGGIAGLSEDDAIQTGKDFAARIPH